MIKKFKIGVKLVRGAYIEKEFNRSRLLGYENPIYSTKKETDKSFKVIAAAFSNLGKLLIINSKSINTPCYILLLIY